MSDYSTSDSASGVRIPPKAIIAGVIAILAIIFVFQNTDKSSLKVFFFTIQMPTWIAFLVLLILGAVIGWVLKGIRDKRRGVS